ncbi:MAG: hypothetical protein IT463_06165 [Planctomycetes bacterium]|nr:hypothetical protein [Planctomycetota bacterium]
MAGWMPVWMRGAAAALLLAAPLAAQSPAEPAEAKPPAPVLLQGEDDPFAAELRQLADAPDKAARLAAFAAVLERAATLKREPDPLVSILRNRKPEETFGELLAWVRESPTARHEAFLPPLVLAGAEAGDSARAALQALKAYGLRAVPQLQAQLASENAPERNAAAVVAGERVGGLQGAAQVIPALVKAAEGGQADTTTLAINSLRRLALLNLDTAAAWREWLGSKSELELVAEIGNREAEARERAEKKLSDVEKELLKVLLERMRRDERNDAALLCKRLKDPGYSAIRVEAAKLLAELLPNLDDVAAKAPLEAVGEVLNDTQAPADLRRQCATALADCRKPLLAFPHIDRCLEANGIGADLKLELVRGLNCPAAAPRLSQLLEAELAVVAERSGPLLEALVGQVRWVLETEDKSPNRDRILGQLAALLQTAADKLGTDLEAPARKRFLDIALKANDALVHLARLRRVDISPCLDALLQLVQRENGAASSAVTTLRHALEAPSAREALRSRLSTPPESEQLGALYGSLLAANDEPLLVNLLGLYESIGISPEPIETLRGRLLDAARASEAQLPPSPETRKTVRDALRGLLAVLYSSQDDHAALVRDLMNCEYGEKDALGYLLVLKDQRVAVLSAALEPLLADRAVRVGMLAAQLADSLAPAERDSAQYKAFRASVSSAVRAALGQDCARAIRDGIPAPERERLEALARGTLHNDFVAAAVEQLRAAGAPGSGRDALAGILLAAVKVAHPEKYDDVKLEGLAQADFETALDSLKTRLKSHGYPVA